MNQGFKTINNHINWRYVSGAQSLYSHLGICHELSYMCINQFTEVGSLSSMFRNYRYRSHNPIHRDI